MLSKKEFEKKQKEIISKLNSERYKREIQKEDIDKTKWQIAFVEDKPELYYWYLIYEKKNIVFEVWQLMIDKFPNIDEPEQYHKFHTFIDNCMNIFELRYWKHKKQYKNKPIYIIDYTNDWK